MKIQVIFYYILLILFPYSLCENKPLTLQYEWCEYSNHYIRSSKALVVLVRES